MLRCHAIRSSVGVNKVVVLRLELLGLVVLMMWRRIRIVLWVVIVVGVVGHVDKNVSPRDLCVGLRS